MGDVVKSRQSASRGKFKNIACVYCHRGMDLAYADLVLPYARPRTHIIVCPSCNGGNQFPLLWRVLAYLLLSAAAGLFLISGIVVMDIYQFEIERVIFAIVPYEWGTAVYICQLILLSVASMMLTNLLSVGLNWLYFDVGFGLEEP
jgi:hypothetical protein